MDAQHLLALGWTGDSSLEERKAREARLPGGTGPVYVIGMEANSSPTASTYAPPLRRSGTSTSTPPQSTCRWPTVNASKPAPLTGPVALAVVSGRSPIAKLVAVLVQLEAQRGYTPPTPRIYALRRMLSAGDDPHSRPTTPRHHGTLRPRTCSGREPTMKITMIAALSIATATTALPIAAIAHADDGYRFLSPSANIGCSMEDDSNGGHTLGGTAGRGLPTRQRAGCHRGTGFRLAG